ncbi:hypothetical protein HZS_7535 [Henneguya salminicola]|nr:hypothetical protein HZS_7535 [Henneguya salminicola]
MIYFKFSKEKIEYYKLFKRNSHDTFIYEIEKVPPKDIDFCYIFQWNNDQNSLYDNRVSVTENAKRNSLFYTCIGNKITMLTFHLGFLFMAARINKGIKWYVRTDPLYIFGKINFHI